MVCCVACGPLALLNACFRPARNVRRRSSVDILASGPWACKADWMSVALTGTRVGCQMRTLAGRPLLFPCLLQKLSIS